MDIPDHPDIRNALIYGYPKVPKYPVCPVCQQECSYFLVDDYGDTVGCDQCLHLENAEFMTSIWKGTWYRGEPTCPKCEKSCDWVYVDNHQMVVGCKSCLKEVDSWEE